MHVTPKSPVLFVEISPWLSVLLTTYYWHPPHEQAEFLAVSTKLQVLLVARTQLDADVVCAALVGNGHGGGDGDSSWVLACRMLHIDLSENRLSNNAASHLGR